MSLEILSSKLDSSVNFIETIGPGRILEARYVRRHPDYVACYLSSQTGCTQSCRMCHLTFTGQNKAEDASVAQIVDQARVVLDYYAKTQPDARVVHYNFMARGEPLSSPNLLRDSQRLLSELGHLAAEYRLLPRFLISSILPRNLEESPLAIFSHLFPVIQPEIYYSLYSMDPEFRRRWLPRAMNPEIALDKLTDWQRHSKKIVRIHYALIKGQNDGLADAVDIAAAVKSRGLRADFTFVRYNSPSERHGEESTNYTKYKEWLEMALPGVRVKTIDRVGPDVAASCGMFIQA